MTAILPLQMFILTCGEHFFVSDNYIKFITQSSP